MAGAPRAGQAAARSAERTAPVAKEKRLPLIDPEEFKECHSIPWDHPDRRTCPQLMKERGFGPGGMGSRMHLPDEPFLLSDGRKVDPHTDIGPGLP